MRKDRLKILYEDKHLIVVFKKSGLPTIKSDKYKDNLYSFVYDYLHKKNQRVFVVHRLDADTSGLVVFAKSERVKDNLQLNWENVKRGYIAIVHGITKESDVIKNYLKETKTLLTYVSKDNSGKYYVILATVALILAIIVGINVIESKIATLNAKKPSLAIISRSYLRNGYHVISGKDIVMEYLSFLEKSTDPFTKKIFCNFILTKNL